MSAELKQSVKLPSKANSVHSHLLNCSEVWRQSHRIGTLTFTAFLIMDQQIVCRSKKRQRENLYDQMCTWACYKLITWSRILKLILILTETKLHHFFFCSTYICSSLRTVLLSDQMIHCLKVTNLDFLISLSMAASHNCPAIGSRRHWQWVTM